jgi:adenylate cyclase
LQAVGCAVAIQTALVEQNAPTARDRQTQVRIGVHLGDVGVRDSDLFGDGVSIAARVEPLAESGGICITGPVFGQVRNKLGTPLVKLPRPELKNIEVPIDVYRVLLPWQQAAAKPGPQGHRRPDPHTWGVVAAVAVAAVLAVWWVIWPHAPRGMSAPPSDAARAQGKKSVAVLPFVNMSSDKENEYFSDGITEDLITALSKVSGLHVAARTSSFAFKGKNEDVRTIGTQLGVDAVLEGSVAKAGNQVRITAQLISTADGYHLWSESYDRELQDIFGIRSQVAETVAKALQVTLAQKPTDDVEAYQLYLKARHATATLDDWATAMRYLQQAIARDPNYALAYLGLADYYVWSVDWELPSLEAMQPDLVTAHEWFGMVLVDLGRFDEGIASIRRAYELDPLAPNVATFIGYNPFFAGRNDAAIEQLRTATSVLHDNWWAHGWLARAYARASRFPEAIAEARKAHQLAPRYAEVESVLGRVYADAGEKAEAEKVLDHLRTRMRDEFVAPPYVATILIGLGRLDEALVEVAKAAEQRSWYVMNWKVDPDLDPLRSDPRFQALMKHLRVPRFDLSGKS